MLKTFKGNHKYIRVFCTLPPRPLLTRSHMMKSEILNLITWSNSPSRQSSTGETFAFSWDSNGDIACLDKEHLKLEVRAGLVSLIDELRASKLGSLGVELIAINAIAFTRNLQNYNSLTKSEVNTHTHIQVELLQLNLIASNEINK